MIRIDIDPAQLEAAQQRLAHIKNGAARALSRALNKTAARAKTAANTEIRQQVNLQAAEVRDKLKIFKANVNQLTAKLSADRRGLLMYHYVTNYSNAQKGRPRTPIRVKVKAGGQTYTLYSAFYVLTKNSHLLTPAYLEGGKLKVLHSPSVSQVLMTVKDAIAPDMNATLAANFQRETDWLYTQHPPPSGDGSEEP